MRRGYIRGAISGEFRDGGYIQNFLLYRGYIRNMYRGLYTKHRGIIFSYVEKRRSFIRRCYIDDLNTVYDQNTSKKSVKLHK